MSAKNAIAPAGSLRSLIRTSFSSGHNALAFAESEIATKEASHIAFFMMVSST
jgi:hypothetical protein